MPKRTKTQNAVHGDSSHINITIKPRKLTPTTKLSLKTTTVATKILLDDAQHGFKNGNFVCSPFSLEILLGMVAAGAKGESLKQLLEFVGHESIDQLLYKSPRAILFSHILSNQFCRGGEGRLDIRLANSIWVDKNLNRAKSCYKEVLKNVFKVEANYADFGNKADQAAREINSWVNKKTRGLIPTIVDGKDLKGVGIALANALYFKGLWSEPFDKNDTKEKDFHLVNGETVLVPFMTSNKKFNYGSFQDVKILQIPYGSQGQSNKFSMYIFLPDEKDGLKKLVQNFHSDPALFYTSFDLDWIQLDELWIPKFKISYKLEAQNAMKQMGLTLPFEPTNTELNYLLEPTNFGYDMLHISKILQKSFIEIDETGTEADACTTTPLTSIGCRKPLPPPPPASFVADHPFMFMIREDTSQAVLFVGVVLNPRTTHP